MENKSKRNISDFLKSKTFWLGAASFMLPALVLYIIFACFGVHPFGDKQILVTDFWHQYYPFLCEFQEKLKAGESLLYSENIGLGINFLALIAYYCASPLNILTVLVPKEGLRDLLVIIVVMKIGFSGLFCWMYLKKVFKRMDLSTIAFASMYALCGYVLGYYWNIMWLDCVALLPLVMLGVYSIINENKFKLYIVALALCVISNFYIGFMVCIFTAMYFFFECIRSEVKIGEFFKKLGLIGVTTIVGLALTAFITIPAYNALGDTVSTVPKNANSQTEKSFMEKVVQFGEDVKDYVEEFGDESPDVIARTLSFNEPVPKTGLPNIFSGFICIVLFGYFLCAKGIKTREKIATCILILVMLLSLTINDIDIIWHGMHKPNMVPYRYAFIFSFVLITMAYRTFTTMKDGQYTIGKKIPAGVLVSVVVTALVILCGVNEKVIKAVTELISDHKLIQETMVATILGCAAIAIIYHLFIYTFYTERNEKNSFAAVVIPVVIILEVIINTVIAVPTVRVTTYSSYYYKGEEIEQLLEMVDADSSYQRVDTSQEYILNDPALYGYKGVSTFTSTANYPVTKFMERIGLCAPARSNRYYYQTTSPLINSILGVEHVIFKNDMKNTNPYLEEAAFVKPDADKNRTVIYKNTQCLPIGFMADENLLAEPLREGNPFEVQNSLFNQLTGLEGDLFTRVSLKSVAGESNIKVTGSKEGEYTFTLDEEFKNDTPVLTLNYVAPDANSIYAFIDGTDITKVVVNNTTYKAAKRKYVFPVGAFKPEDKIKFKFTFEGSYDGKANVKFHVYTMNDELFKQGMEILRDEPFEISKYESTKIEGKINVKEDGVFYASIPYEKGWSMYVDGEKTEITPYEGAFVCAKIKPGEHTITLKYSPHGYGVGVMLAIGGLGAFVALIVLERLIKRRKHHGQDIDSSALLQ